MTMVEMTRNELNDVSDARNELIIRRRLLDEMLTTASHFLGENPDFFDVISSEMDRLNDEIEFIDQRIAGMEV